MERESKKEDVGSQENHNLQQKESEGVLQSREENTHVNQYHRALGARERYRSGGRYRGAIAEVRKDGRGSRKEKNGSHGG